MLQCGLDLLGVPRSGFLHFNLFSCKACKSYFSFICSPHVWSGIRMIRMHLLQSMHHLFLAHPALQNLTNESFVEISGHWNGVLSRLQVAWQVMYELGWMHSARQFAKSCQALLGWYLYVVPVGYWGRASHFYAVWPCATMCDLCLAKLKQTLAGLCVATRREVCPSFYTFLHSFIYTLTGR